MGKIIWRLFRTLFWGLLILPLLIVIPIILVVLIKLFTKTMTVLTILLFFILVYNFIKENDELKEWRKTR